MKTTGKRYFFQFSNCYVTRRLKGYEIVKEENNLNQERFEDISPLKIGN